MIPHWLSLKSLAYLRRSFFCIMLSVYYFFPISTTSNYLGYQFTVRRSRDVKRDENGVLRRMWYRKVALYVPHDPQYVKYAKPNSLAKRLKAGVAEMLMFMTFKKARSLRLPLPDPVNRALHLVNFRSLCLIPGNQRGNCSVIVFQYTALTKAINDRKNAKKPTH